MASREMDAPEAGARGKEIARSAGMYVISIISITFV